MDKLKSLREAMQASNSLDTLPCLPCVDQCPTPKARDDDMYVSQDVTVTEKNDTSQTRSYFLTRVKDIHYEKEAAALKTYGFVGEDRYLSPNDLVERIKAGTFTIDSDEADEPSYCPLEAFSWTMIKKDPKGLAAYRAALNDLTVQTKDSIWAETDFSKLPGLVAAFKAATVTPIVLN